MSKRCAKIAFVQADDPRSNLRVPNRVDWVSECCRLLAEDDEDVYFISSRSAESLAATPAPHPAAEGGRAAVPLRVGAAVRALWGDG